MSSRYVQPLRILNQFIFLAFMLWLGIRFFQFVQFFRSGGATAFVPRPVAPILAVCFHLPVG